MDEQPPVIPEQDLEELKNSLREEIQAEMAPVFEEKEAEIIAKAKEQAEAIIENANHDAEVAKESILKMASAQGYEEGTNRAKTEAERRMAEIEAERIQLEQQYEAKTHTV